MYLDDMVNRWGRRQTENLYGAFYLYFRPSQGKRAGEVRIETEAPEGFQLADSRRISPAWTPQQVKAWVLDIERRLPILAVE